MSEPIDYYFMVNSPWTYLGSELFDRIARKHGARILYKPVDLVHIFAQSGGLPLPKRAPQRQAYRMVELHRWRALRDLPLNVTPAHFKPVAPHLANRMLVALALTDTDPGPLSRALMRAVWAEDRDIWDEATLTAIATERGLDGGDLVARAGTDEIEAVYAANTKEALAAQVFGAPTYVRRGEPFWGQDRLEMLDAALAEGRAAIPVADFVPEPPTTEGDTP
ncbi:MAG: 2-hydroxychromene-2-carboxylate isomerase [Alphaproteobacteria bacterium]